MIHTKIPNRADDASRIVKTNAQTIRPKILTVDDDPDITHVIETILGDYAVDVICNYDSQQGIWNTMTEKPDLIITDWMMPNGDGEDLVTNIMRNRDTAHIPIIVLTCLGGTRLQRRLASLGVSACLQKPVRHDRLLAEIKRHIELPPLAWASTDTSHD